MSAVARRYAKALFELGQQQGDFEAVGRELADVVKVFEQPLLRRFAEQSTLDRANRRTVVARLAGRLGASQLIAKFLGVLAQNNRLADLKAIGVEYRRREDRALNRVRARIASARSLPDDSRRRIEGIFEAKTGKQVLAAAAVDPDLLGGVVVELQGRVFDGSLRTQLERLKRSLTG